MYKIQIFFYYSFNEKVERKSQMKQTFGKPAFCLTKNNEKQWQYSIKSNQSKQP